MRPAQVHALRAALATSLSLAAGLPGPVLAADRPSPARAGLPPPEGMAESPIHRLVPGIQASPMGPGRVSGWPAWLEDRTSPARPPRQGRLWAGAEASFADLAGRDFSHQDLRGVVLFGASLRNADLRFADLTGADLTGADLRGAKLDGAKLAGARLYLARAEGARGLNLAGTALHPFFEPGPEDILGSVKIYQLPDPTYQPGQLLVGSTGDLFLLQPGRSCHWIVTPTGFAQETLIHGAEPGAEPPAQRLMVKGPGARICFIRHGAIHMVEDRCIGARAPERVFELPTDYNGAQCAVAAGPDQLWTALPQICWVYRGDWRLSTSVHTRYLALKDAHFESLAATPDGALVFGADPGLDRIVLMPGNLPTVGENKRADLGCGASPLPAGSRPRSITWGAGGRVWYLLPGLDGICSDRVDGMTLQGRALESLAGPEQLVRGLHNRGLHSLVHGPDGNMWFSQQTPPGLGRITPDGACRIWPLAPGMVPGALAPGPDGRIYFTLEGQAAIASIQAVARGGAQAPSLPELLLPGLAWARPEPSEAAPARASKAVAVVPEPPPKAAAVVPEPEPKAAAVVREPARPAAPPPPEPESARQALAALGLHFDYTLHGEPQDRLQHILATHGFNAAPEKSRFDEAHSTAEGLSALLLEGVRTAGELGRVVRRYDPAGMGHTPCHFGRPVGYQWDGWDWAPTAWVDLVTRSWRGPDGSVRTVIWTAFPCSPNRF